MGVDIIEASGQATGRTGNADDMFPTGATRYIPYTFYPILNITEDGNGIISFQFMSGGEGQQPVEILPDITSAIENTEENTIEREIIAIHSITGQSIASTDVTTLPAGIYLITMKNKNANSTLQTKKIFVKKI